MKALMNRLKSSRPFKEFYTDWINTLKSSLLPLLSQSPSHPLQFDQASNDDVSQLLFPDWRNPLEKPFLWFRDFHPYIFTNLLRSFLEDDDTNDSDDGQRFEFLGKPLNVSKTHGVSLGHIVEQVECGLRLMVPSIVARSRDAQAALVDQLAVGWRVMAENFEVDEALGDLVDKMTCVFLDANRLRRSVLADIMGALNVYQAAAFLEGLAQFYVGFWDPKLLAQLNNS